MLADITSERWPASGWNHWPTSSEYTAIGPNTFTTRMKATDLGPVYKRTNTGPVFYNLNLKGHYDQNGVIVSDVDNIIISEDRKRGAPKPSPDILPNLDGPEPDEVLEDCVNPLT
jgi:hypothetical protein